MKNEDEWEDLDDVVRKLGKPAVTLNHAVIDSLDDQPVNARDLQVTMSVEELLGEIRANGNIIAQAFTNEKRRANFWRAIALGIIAGHVAFATWYFITTIID